MLQMFLIAAIVGVASPLQQTQSKPQSPPAVFADQIVVSAALEEEERRDLPASVTLIGREEIRDRQASEVYDLLRTVPGLAVAQSGSPGKVVSVFSRGAESNQLLVLWNGMRLNDPFFGGFDWARLPTDGVDRIEIVRGPASTIYGSDAMGGVVQILSGSLDGGAARLEGGGDGYGRVGFAWGGDLGRTRVDVAGHTRQGDGRAKNDFFDGDDVMASLDWKLGSASSLGLLARAARSEIGIPVASGTATPLRRQESDIRQLAVPFEVDLGRWHVEASLSSVEADLVFVDPDAVFSRSETDAERLRLRSVASYEVNEGFWLAAGGDWEKEEVTNDTNFGLNLEAESRQNYSFFGELQKQWGRVRVDLGVRRDEDEFFGGESSPRAGLVVNVGRMMQFFVTYGEGFRAPSLGELFFPFFGNPSLEPEESESWEAGLRFGHRDWNLNLALFTNEYKNLIDSDPVTFTAVNIGKAETRGVEVEVVFRRGILNARGYLTLLDTEDLASGEELLRRPERSGGLVVTVKPGPFSATLVARYVGDRDDLDPVSFARAVNRSYFVADLALTWEATSSLAPYARVQNVANQSYEEVLGFPAPDRTLIVGLEVGIP